MAGNVGLTDTQKKDFFTLTTRKADALIGKAKPLTEKMEETLSSLIEKDKNPELPQGAKTYVKQWLKQQKYKRYKQIKSKYIDKGNATEQKGFTLMSTELNLGMVYSNTEFKSNDFMCGTCDLDMPDIDTVYDNKSSWDLDTFPMYDTEIPNKDYEAQIQGYMELWDRSKGAVVYTLIDIPEDQLIREFPWNGSDDAKQEVAINLIYTREYWDAMKAKYFPNAKDIEFIEIPASERVKPFYFERDRDYIANVKKRAEMCEAYVKELIGGGNE